MSPSGAHSLSQEIGVNEVHTKVLWSLRGSDSGAIVWYVYMGIATVVCAFVALTIEFAGIIADKEKKLASGFLKKESAVFETIGLKKKL